jgi:hypothetical protein
MTLETPRRRSDQRATSRVAPERRAEALVAAYIHALSPRHDAEREAGGTPVRTRPSPPMVELRSPMEHNSTSGAQLMVR